MPKVAQKRDSFVSHDIEKATRGLKGVKFHTLQEFNVGSTGVFSATTGTSPWELHPDSDEFLYVLEGEAVVTILTDDGAVDVELHEGCCLVVPRGYWHRHNVEGQLKELFVTPGSTQHSKAEDPRGAKGTGKAAAKKKSGKKLSDVIREYALSFPETHEDQPWGHPAFKVKNKTFLWMSFKEQGINISVKLSDSLFKALALPFAEPSGYGLGKSGWITAQLDSDDSLSEDVIKTWISESFANVAPKTLLRQLHEKTADRKSAQLAGNVALNKTEMKKTPMGNALVKVSVSKTSVNKTIP